MGIIHSFYLYLLTNPTSDLDPRSSGHRSSTLSPQPPNFVAKMFTKQRTVRLLLLALMATQWSMTVYCQSIGINSLLPTLLPPLTDDSNDSSFNIVDYLRNPIWSYSPDQDRNTCEIIQARGFDCETHSVTTYQGYIIQLHRIPPSNNQNAKRSNGQLKPALVQTGLIGTSADFIMATDNVSKNQSVIGENLGIELAKQGYDVWLSNNRGNEYALDHVNLSSSDDKFWEFSFDEMSQYDIPSIIEYVLNETGYDQLHYIGHSQGTAVMFGLLSQTDAYNKVIKNFIAISPITRIGSAKTSMRFLTAALDALKLLDSGSVFTKNILTDKVLPLACDTPGRIICEFVYFSVTGPDFQQIQSDRMGVYLGHMPTSTSAQNLKHFNQLFNTNKFQKFDYGNDEKNQKAYGQTTPPEYLLTNITHPSVYVIYSNNDWFVPLDGVEALKNDLTVAKEFYLISNSRSNHMDPLVGKAISVEVNKKILNILEQNP